MILLKETTSGTCDQFLLNTVDGISQFYLTLKDWHGERAHEVMGYSNLYNGGYGQFFVQGNWCDKYTYTE